MLIGQNLYLKERIEKNYLFVAKNGGSGGEDSIKHNATSDYKTIHGKPGTSATNLSCGGGGSGGSYGHSGWNITNKAPSGNSYGGGFGTDSAAEYNYNSLGAKTSGGLLVCFGESISGSGTFKSIGSNAKARTTSVWAGGGGSGGGCIVLIYERNCSFESRKHFSNWRINK